jgi:glycine cleavage system regulatory protein
MHSALVMTIIGEDRPGLVESVARVVAEHGGNWLESRMSRLGGQFAGILRVEIAGDKEKSMVESLRQLSAQGLNVVVHPDHRRHPTAEGKLKLLEVVGHDRPGIVRQISQALARHGVNVEELHTELQSAPMSGESLFKATAEIFIPPTVDMAALRQDLEKIAADLIVDISFEELPTEPA